MKKCWVDRNKHFKPAFRSIEALNRHKKLMLWLPVTRYKKACPWGYAFTDDPKMLEPIDEKYANNHLLLWVKAMEYLKGSSYVEVARWLTEASGNYISDVGLKIIAQERPLLPNVYDYKNKIIYDREKRQKDYDTIT